MCEKCRGLIGISKDKKASVLLFDDTKITFDANYFHGFMEVNHEDDGTPYAFIKEEVEIASTGRSYGIAISIKYCPFCGEKLYEETN